MVLVGSKRSFQTGGAKAPSGQPALLHFSNFNGKKIPSVDSVLWDTFAFPGFARAGLSTFAH
jgi:hypothetical protein